MLLLPPTPGDDDINDLLTFEIPTSCRYFDRSDDEDGLAVPFSFVLLMQMLVEWIRLFSLPPKLLLFPVADDDDEANGGIRDGITKGLLLLVAAIVLSIETTPFSTLARCKINFENVRRMIEPYSGWCRRIFSWDKQRQASLRDGRVRDMYCYHLIPDFDLLHLYLPSFMMSLRRCFSSQFNFNFKIVVRVDFMHARGVLSFLRLI